MHPAEWMRRLLEPVAARVRALASRGVVALSDDSRRAQELQITALAGETLQAERFGEFGFVSRPPAGAEVLVVCIGGDRGHAIVVATEDRASRPQGLAVGEAGLYAASGGSVVARLTIRASGVVEVEASELRILGSGSLAAGGDVSDAVGSLAQLRDAYNSHTHAVTTAPGTTSTPTPTVP